MQLTECKSAGPDEFIDSGPAASALDADVLTLNLSALGVCDVQNLRPGSPMPPAMAHCDQAAKYATALKRFLIALLASADMQTLRRSSPMQSTNANLPDRSNLSKRARRPQP